MLRTERAWVEDGWDREPNYEAMCAARRLLDTDPAGAHAELRRLAERGSVKAMVFLGTIYRRGQNAEKDLSEAEEWYLRAARLDYIPATYLLGVTYSNQRRYWMAFEQFKIAARNNYVPAIHSLGMMYERGKGVAADPSKAKEIWERGSVFGNLRTRAALGRLLMSGKSGLVQWLRGMWLEHQAVVLGFIIQWRNPKDPRLD